MEDARPPFDGRIIPPPPRLSSLGVFGASAIFTALAIGSGELMFWPALVVTTGAGVIWVAITVIILQWFVNIEVARYSLATGNTVGTGIGGRSPVVAFLLLLGALVPWIWPGWIRAGGQMVAAVTGIGEKPISLLLLVICAASLLVPRSAYLFLERIQSWMLAGILIGIAWLFAVVAWSAGGFGAFLGEFLTFEGTAEAMGGVARQENSTYFALLSGVVFAGAGGILNLGYGYLVLARNRARAEQGGPAPAPDGGEPDALWRRWIRVLRYEHGILFAGGNIASVLFLSALFFMIYRASGSEASGINLLAQTFDRIGTSYGSSNAVIFAIVGFLVFFTSSIGILDLTCRIAADIFQALFKVRGIGKYPVFAVFVVSQSFLSAALIFIDPRQPFWLISTAAVLNTLVMAIYAFAVILLNRSTLNRRARAPMLVEAIVALLGTMYAGVFILTLVKLATS
jgi:hypothetical protein